MDAKVDNHPKIKEIGAAAPLVLNIVWENGTRHEGVYISILVKHSPVLAPIAESTELFTKVEVGDWGWCAHWNDDIEVSASSLWKLALSQDGTKFREWRKKRGMTQDGVADALGLSQRMIKYYEAGQALIPKTVWLAKDGYDARTHRALTAAAS